MSSRIVELLGTEAEDLLGYECQTVSKEMLHLPGPTFVSEVCPASDRPKAVLRNLETLFNCGRLGKTGCLWILPVAPGSSPTERPSRNA